jgi:hypothetical protein
MYSYVQAQLCGRAGGGSVCSSTESSLGLHIVKMFRQPPLYTTACTVYNVERKKRTMELVVTFDI